MYVCFSLSWSVTTSVCVPSMALVLGGWYKVQSIFQTSAGLLLSCSDIKSVCLAICLSVCLSVTLAVCGTGCLSVPALVWHAGWLGAIQTAGSLLCSASGCLWENEASVGLPACHCASHTLTPQIIPATHWKTLPPPPKTLSTPNIEVF